VLSRESFGAFGWPAAMIVWGRGFTSATHRHHSVQLIMTMHGELLRRQRAVSIHPGVARVLEHLPERLANSAGSSLDSLAALSGLSRSRFMHAFTESVGVPLRPYVLWLRLQQAMCELMGGANVTTAAQNAGFSDAAHLTRTFRRMLGLTPTELQLHRRASRGIAAHVRVRLVPLFEAEPYRRAAKAS
jgi:AraC-like DNA-binding protein